MKYFVTDLKTKTLYISVCDTYNDALRDLKEAEQWDKEENIYCQYIIMKGEDLESSIKVEI